MFTKSHVTKDFMGFILGCTNAKEFIKAVDENFMSSNKVLANILMKKLLGKSFDNSKSVREDIMKMRDMAAQLKSLEVKIFESFLVHFILNYLCFEYSHFKISHNA